MVRGYPLCLGFGDVHFNGGVSLTPNLDEMTTADHTIVFHRGYSGAANCSPTRASVLTGRTADRDCVYDPNSNCGGIPAWECSVYFPLSPSLFTVADAVKKSGFGYQTLFIGKWHLGDFWQKTGLNDWGQDTAPSNPSMLGFDHWHATEGKVATATGNCGCPAFQIDGEVQMQNCEMGHYEEEEEALEFESDPWCGTYWFPDDTTSTGVNNISYIVGEDFNGDIEDRRDSHYMMSVLEQYLNDTLDLDQPMLILLWMHSPHIEFIATEHFREGCSDGTYCDLSREDPITDSETLDYYGTIADFDDQMGRLRQMLRDFGISENTFLYFTSDNGPQVGNTGGLRGKKGNYFEGGIRVPTIIEWPAVIPSGSHNISYPIYTPDFLPTVMDLLGVESDTPHFALDGVSYLDVLVDPLSALTRTSPMGFNNVLSGYVWMDGDMKLVSSKGLLVKGGHVYLFNVSADPWEREDLSTIYPEMFERMKSEYAAWYLGVFMSMSQDTNCIADLSLPAVMSTIDLDPDELGDIEDVIAGLYAESGIPEESRLQFNVQWHQQSKRGNMKGNMSMAGPIMMWVVLIIGSVLSIVLLEFDRIRNATKGSRGMRDDVNYKLDEITFQNECLYNLARRSPC